MSAVISECGQYRYQLRRAADLDAPTYGPAVFCMLNPSTADASLDDPTIRRCRGFAARWRCDGLLVVNLYALRSTSPKALWTHADPVGEHNDYWLAQTARAAGRVVCAWGANARPDRVAAVVALLRDVRAELVCLGTTKDGAPRHPLYVRGEESLVPWGLR